jgi:hypothetical protein
MKIYYQKNLRLIETREGKRIRNNEEIDNIIRKKI